MQSPLEVIIGGLKVNTQNFRQVASLVDENNKPYCTATLVTPNKLVTAGHCIYYLNNPNLIQFEELRNWINKKDNWTLHQNIATYIATLSENAKNNLRININGEILTHAVKSVTVDSSWQRLNQNWAMYFLSNEGVKPLPFYFSDRTIITLNRKIENITPIPILSEVEFKSLERRLATKNEKLTVVQIGFGLRKDPSQLAASLSAFKLKKALKNLSGEKYQVTLPLHGMWQGLNGLRAAIGINGKAACFGDSGGPTLIKLEDNQWRLLASLSSGLDGAHCGQSNPEFWPSDLQNLRDATDIVDVWH